MSNLIRFGIAMDEHLLEQFDALLKSKGYSNRSEAVRDLVRESLVSEQWQQCNEAVASVTIVYDHHIRELPQKLTDIQHHYNTLILTTTHIHLDHDHCLEMIAVKGNTTEIKTFFDKIRGLKGVKHGGMVATTSGKDL